MSRPIDTEILTQDTTLLSAPEAPKRPIVLTLPTGEVVVASDDGGSDRVRCDHPEVAPEQAVVLGEALLEEAAARGRSRLVALAPASLEAGLVEAGMEVEAVMPGFYEGREGCVVLGAAIDGELVSAHGAEVARVDALLKEPRAPKPRPDVVTRRAEVEDAEAIAALLGEVFAAYPTPSDDPAYVAAQLREGTPFRLVEDGGEIIACASADLVTEARTAELTDCATRPDARGRGLMRALLGDLMDDLRELEYPTAFTMARARIPGVNIAFQRLGFVWRGRMVQSCRIGQGIEDMNVWSRAL